jgi:hypothetical protein
VTTNRERVKAIGFTKKLNNTFPILSDKGLKENDLKTQNSGNISCCM